VTARALAALPVVAEYAAPLLRMGGTLVAWKGRPDPAETADAAAAAAALGLEVVEVVRVKPHPAARHRYLHVLRKVAPTPPRFPRRPGAAAKRPLRAA
jgi:16S rRNA (guanine527-N7)-methyltransferase